MVQPLGIAGVRAGPAEERSLGAVGMEVDGPAEPPPPANHSVARA